MRNRNLPDGDLEDNPLGDVVCQACEYRGTSADFLQIDARDSICPRCGEPQEHVYEV